MARRTLTRAVNTGNLKGDMGLPEASKGGMDRGMVSPCLATTAPRKASMVLLRASMATSRVTAVNSRVTVVNSRGMEVNSRVMEVSRISGRGVSQEVLASKDLFMACMVQMVSCTLRATKKPSSAAAITRTALLLPSLNLCEFSCKLLQVNEHIRCSALCCLPDPPEIA